MDTDKNCNVDKNTFEKSINKTRHNPESQPEKKNHLKADYVKYGINKIINYNFPYKDDKHYPRSFTKQYYTHNIPIGEVVDRQ